MMNNKIMVLLIATILWYSGSYSQTSFLEKNGPIDNSSLRAEAFRMKGKLAGLTKIQISNIIKARKLRDQRLKLGTIDRKADEKNNLVPLYNEHLGKTYIHRSFNKYVASQVTFEQYKKLFLEQLTPQIEARTEDKLSALYQMDNDNSDKYKKLHSAIFKKEKEKLMTYHYYSYNKDSLKLKMSELELPLNSNDKYSRNSKLKKVKNFIIAATKAGVDNQRISKILNELEVQDKKIVAIENTGKNGEDHIIRLDENAFSKRKVRDKFKEYISKHLSEEEYFKIFGKQLEPIINDRTKSRMDQITQIYKFKNKDYEEVKAMIKEQMKKEVIAELFYSFDKKLAKSKTRALQYRFETIYREKIKRIIE